MKKKEKYYQVGLCPNCEEHTRQEYIGGVHEYGAEHPNRGKRFVYGDVHTLSFFRCDGCSEVIGYRTYYADCPDIDEAENLPLTWIVDLDDLDSESAFKNHSTLIYPTSARERERQLSEHLPQKITRLYERALTVKRTEPYSFATQIGVALEAICIDLGGQGKNLSDDVAHLSQRGIFPKHVEEIANELKTLRNAAAHASPRSPRNIGYEKVDAIDDFFHLIVNYAYDAPAKLKKYKRLLTPKERGKRRQILVAKSVH